MGESERDEHLSRISTIWADLFRAHGESADSAAAARQRLVLRYYPAAYRYLLKLVSDPDAALDLAQEFAHRLFRGDFRRAAPERGRFRNFLKSTLIHLAVDYVRRKGKEPGPLTPDLPERETRAPSAEDDEPFLTIWRRELLDHAWKGLRDLEQRTNRPYHTVLRFHVDNPGVRSAELAERLTPQLGRALSPEWVYKRLHQAREAFKDLLVAEVARTLEGQWAADLEEELAHLGLLDTCRSALARRQARP